jgi:hypothetical protein
MARARDSASRLVIACDESGYEGMRLIGGMTEVFAHASVNLDAESSADCIVELRRRIRSPAVEYKANHLLRERHRGALTWFLGSEGPVLGNAWVHLTEKPYLLVRKILHLLAPGAAEAGVANDLYRHRGISREPWEAFLVACNAWLRAKDPVSAEASQLLLHGRLGRLGLAELDDRSARAIETMEMALGDGPTRPRQPTAGGGGIALDPLLAAILRGVALWSESAGRVAVIHDRQNTLTEARIALLGEMVALGGLTMDGFTLVDSLADPRVQVADFLAGVARRISEDELEGRRDSELADLLRPYVDPLSMWGDPVSWQRIGPV